MNALAAAIKKHCDAQQLTLATAESVTVGHLQASIAGVSGASSFFQGGITAYTVDQKVQLLGIDRRHADEVDCVSERVAAEMAQARQRCSARTSASPPPGMRKHRTRPRRARMRSMPSGTRSNPMDRWCARDR